MKEHNYDSINWGKLFYYDPTSRSGLRWAVDKYSAYGKKKETWSGKEAGTLSDVKNKENKAWAISLFLDGKYKHYKVHRIIAVMHGISVNGKQRNKSFSVNKHGILPAFAMAVKYRTEVLEELYKE